MVKDSNGNEVKVGDTVTWTGKVVAVRDGQDRLNLEVEALRPDQSEVVLTLDANMTVKR